METPHATKTYDFERPGHRPAHHISSLAMYFGVFFALMIMTIITVAASRVDLGAWNVPVAITIAVIKMTLVILFFMHVIHSSRLTWIIVIASFLWLGVLFVLTFSDYLTRTWNLYQ